MARRKTTTKAATSQRPRERDWRPDDEKARGRLAIAGIGDAKAYALPVVGDCMAPAICDGDMLIVSPDAPVAEGEPVVIWPLSGDPKLKRLVSPATLHKFVPLSPASEVDPLFLFKADDNDRVLMVRASRLAAIHGILRVIRSAEVPKFRLPAATA